MFNLQNLGSKNSPTSTLRYHDPAPDSLFSWTNTNPNPVEGDPEYGNLKRNDASVIISEIPSSFLVAWIPAGVFGVGERLRFKLENLANPGTATSEHCKVSVQLKLEIIF
jgi:hypothetical protein